MLELKSNWEITNVSPAHLIGDIEYFVDHLINWTYASEKTVIEELQKFANIHQVSFTFNGEDAEGDVIVHFSPQIQNK